MDSSIAEIGAVNGERGLRTWHLIPSAAEYARRRRRQRCDGPRSVAFSRGRFRTVQFHCAGEIVQSKVLLIWVLSAVEEDEIRCGGHYRRELPEPLSGLLGGRGVRGRQRKHPVEIQRVVRLPKNALGAAINRGLLNGGPLGAVFSGAEDRGGPGEAVGGRILLGESQRGRLICGVNVRATWESGVCGESFELQC